MAPELLDTSRIRKLLFLGPRGSYSDFAKNTFIDSFNLNCVSTNLKSISSIIRALKDENSEDIAAVIPIENSIEGKLLIIYLRLRKKTLKLLQKQQWV